MANLFKNAIAKNVGSSNVTVYTCPTGKTAIVSGLSVANIHTDSISVDVLLTDTSASLEVSIVKDAPVDVGGSLIPIGGLQKLVLEAGDIIKVASSAANSADVVISVLEIG